MASHTTYPPNSPMYKLLLGLLFISFIHALQNQPQDQYSFSTSGGVQYGILRRYLIAGGVEDAQAVLNKAMVDFYLLCGLTLLIIYYLL